MTNCPRCNTRQKFILKKVQVEDDLWQMRVECKTCKWFNVAIEGKESKIDIYNQYRKLKVRAQKDPSLKRRLNLLAEKLK